MEEFLLAAGVAREALPTVIEVAQRFFAEGKNPTPDDMAALRAKQKAEEDEFNKDL